MGKLRFRLLVLACLFTPLLAIAEDAPPIQDSPNFLDKTHEVLSNTFYWPFAWFDHFFIKPTDEYEVNQSYFRVINNYTWVDHEGFRYKPQIRMKVRLKAFQRKLSLIAFGENDEDKTSSLPAPQQTKVARGAQPADERTRVGFSYHAVEWLNSLLDADVVINSHLVPEPSVRARQRLISNDKTLSRFTVTGFWEQKIRFGEKTQLDYQRQFTKRLESDITATAKQSQVFPDLVWDNSINTSYQLSDKDSLTSHLSAAGPTRPHTIVQNYHTSVVYRRNFYRPWIFGEVEPGVDWPYVDNHRPPIWSAAFRLELQFRSE